MMLHSRRKDEPLTYYHVPEPNEWQIKSCLKGHDYRTPKPVRFHLLIPILFAIFIFLAVWFFRNW